jgi:hypothetical protein
MISACPRGMASSPSNPRRRLAESNAVMTASATIVPLRWFTSRCGVPGVLRIALKKDDRKHLQRSHRLRKPSTRAECRRKQRGRLSDALMLRSPEERNDSQNTRALRRSGGHHRDHGPGRCSNEQDAPSHEALFTCLVGRRIVVGAGVQGEVEGARHEGPNQSPSQGQGQEAREARRDAKGAEAGHPAALTVP